MPYHLTFDSNGIYHHVPFNVQAPHAVSYNPGSLSFSYRGYEGDQLDQAAIDNAAKIINFYKDNHGFTDQQFLTHPQTGQAGTRSGGKDPREAQWLPAALARAHELKGQPATPPSADVASASPPTTPSPQTSTDVPAPTFVREGRMSLGGAVPSDQSQSTSAQSSTPTAGKPMPSNNQGRVTFQGPNDPNVINQAQTLAIQANRSQVIADK
jgi:hypothetical protein